MKPWIRRFLLAAGFWILLSPFAFAFDHGAWDSLLKAHVENGKVDYPGFLSEKAKLDHYLETVYQMPVEFFADQSREERMAAWINVYNASVIRLILEHGPVDSVEKIPGFWDDKAAGIAGMRYSLKDIREKIFRRGFRDERATLALVSGRKDSGALREEAYAGERLIEQLRDQMNSFLTDERYNQIHPKQKRLKLSPLFRELADDFVLGYGNAEKDSQFSPQELAILGFIRVHVNDPQTKEWVEKRKYKLRYLPADASLNQKAG
jgi:hypothetical protein